MTSAVTPLQSVLHEVISCESTQDEVKRLLLQSTNEPQILHWMLCDFQTKGRGRQGTEWHTSASKDAQLITSVGYKNTALDALGPVLSLVAGEALYAAIQNFSRQHQSIFFIKWPNDLYVLSKDQNQAPQKVAGILCERHPKNGTVIGFGVNLLWSPELLSQQTSYLEAHLINDEPAQLRRALLTQLMSEFERLLSEFLKDPKNFQQDLIAQLQTKSMRPFLDLSEIKVMGKNVRPIKLNNDGTLEAFDLSINQQIRMI